MRFYSYFCPNCGNNLDIISKVNLVKNIVSFKDNIKKDDKDEEIDSKDVIQDQDLDRFYNILYKIPAYSKAQVKVLTSTPVIYSVEVVNTPQTRAQGLMYRDKIDDYTGMLFVMPDDVMFSFWMKDVKFSLDILFIDKNLTIIYIVHNADSCMQDACKAFAPNDAYRYVLEVPGGSASLNNIHVGDKIEVIINYDQ